MKTRVITAAVAVPLMLVIILALPKIVAAILLGLMSAIGAYELLEGTKLVREFRLVVYSMLAAVGVHIWCYFGMPLVWGVLGIMVFVSLLFMELLLSGAKMPVRSIALSVVAGLLLPFMLASLTRLFGLEKGRIAIMIPFVLAFLSDTGAYFVGCALGKHKLAPVISPNKSVEGLFGGVAGAIAGAELFCLIVGLIFKQEVNYLYGLLYGIVGSLTAVFGDLCFSAIKRQTGIKDYGNLIPGHGGVLDRLDSVLFVAPVTEILMLLIPLVK